MRVKDNLRYEVVKHHSPHDFHIRMPISARAKKLNPALGNYWEARLIEVEQAGKTIRYITSLIDSKRYPLLSLAKLYIQRWEVEMCYREIKSNLQERKHLRSKQPALIYLDLSRIMGCLYCL